MNSHALPRLLLTLCSVTLIACTSGNANEDSAAVPGADRAAASEESQEDSAAQPSAEGTAPEQEERAKDDIYQRPADVTVDFSGDPMYRGHYHEAAASRMCGAPSFGMPGEEKSFAFEFPYEGDLRINDVSFVAKELQPGGSTTTFVLNVALENAPGAHPPKVSIQAGQPRSEDSGTATLAQRGDTTVLHVTGKDFYGTLDMTVRCGPKAK